MEYGYTKKNNSRNFNSRKLLDTYFSPSVNVGLAKEIMANPVKQLQQAVARGYIKGDSLIDLSFGSFLHFAGSLYNKFRDVTLLRSNEDCVTEVKKWLHNGAGAYDWSKMGSIIADMVDYKQPVAAAELQFKSAVKHVLKCDLNNYNIADPMELSPADCVLVAGAVEMACEDEEGFRRSLGNVVRMLKSGGQLAYFGTLNATYFRCGGETYKIFPYDANRLLKTCMDLGLIIHHVDIHKSKNKYDLTDHTATIFLIAEKRS